MDALVWLYGKIAHGMGTFVFGKKTPSERSHRHGNGKMGPSSENTCGRRLKERCGGMIWSITKSTVGFNQQPERDGNMSMITNVMSSLT